MGASLTRLHALLTTYHFSSSRRQLLDHLPDERLGLAPERLWSWYVAAVAVVCGPAPDVEHVERRPPSRPPEPQPTADATTCTYEPADEGDADPAHHACATADGEQQHARHGRRDGRRDARNGHGRDEQDEPRAVACSSSMQTVPARIESAGDYRTDPSANTVQQDEDETTHRQSS
ncbi:hypothetical protein L226DRAFT_346278 [Lentinus tigrinus ALCF2SS1-7]|uniref:uncharacterized protein n=1 Tax=Lentinus tigrinus ALCF2SS1-7 TaxID=1328758 RepID=UPI001165DAD4|nr:hypothetical protein L226DRAFT_346278 [Lentinus tigrinus ALCF2SS1-7]